MQICESKTVIDSFQAVQNPFFPLGDNNFICDTLKLCRLFTFSSITHYMKGQF